MTDALYVDAYSGLKDGYHVSAIPTQSRRHTVLLILDSRIVDGVSGVRLNDTRHLEEFAYQEWESCFV